MKIGTKHDFHVVNGLGDLVVHFWLARKSFTMQDLVRRTFKFGSIALCVFAALNVLYPTQFKGWQLWLGAENIALASATAATLVGYNLISLTLVREAWAHKHKLLAGFGAVFMTMVFCVVIEAAWNFYDTSSAKAVSISQASTGGAADRLSDARTALAALDVGAKAEAESFAKAYADAPANRLNGRAALQKQHATQVAADRAERARLEKELSQARGANVAAATDTFDPRPIDKVMAPWFGISRETMAATNDMIRAVCFELLVIFGVPLGTAVALSKVGMAEEAADIAKAQSEAPETAIKPANDEDIDGLPDLSDQPFTASRAVDDRRNSERSRRGHATRRAKQLAEQDDAAPPKGTDDARAADDVVTVEDIPEPAQEEEPDIEAVTVLEPEEEDEEVIAA